MPMRLAAVAVLAVALVAVVLVIVKATSGGGRVQPEDIVLRLSDLPAGFKMGDDTACGPLGTEGMGPQLKALTLQDHPLACYRQFERPHVSGDPGRVELIESTAVIFSSGTRASAALASLEGLLQYLGTESAGSATTQVQIGDESRTLLVRELNSDEKGILIAWRSGPVLSYVRIGGLPSGNPLDYAADLARIQQARVLHPVPASPADTDDRAAALDRPALGVPVYWLGLDAAPSGTLPGLKLARSEGPIARGSGPGHSVQIEYEADPGKVAVILTIWRRDAWDSYLGSQLGDLATAPPCHQPRVIQLADRRIEVHPPSVPGLNPTPAPPTTPALGPQSFTATPVATSATLCPPGYVGHVYFQDAVVAINIPFCMTCVTPQGPYNSDEGIETSARALRLR
jgi:hypothetical protein